jgi:hypothetical protein
MLGLYQEVFMMSQSIIELASFAAAGDLQRPGFAFKSNY